MLKTRTRIKKAYTQPDGSKVPILDIEAFNIDAGEQVVLIGPSGCGKTTMLHTIAGITKPDSGKVFIDGHRANQVFRTGSGSHPSQQAWVTCFQTFNLLPGFLGL